MGRDDLYRALIEVARQRDTITYGEIAPLVGLTMVRPPDRGALGALLDEVDRAELAAGRPLLCAIVVRRDRGLPGRGFFRNARLLGFDPESADAAFWRAELERVHDWWAGSAEDPDIRPSPRSVKPV